ncbi:restriction endonuclease [Pseudomonas putida SJTE-1]|uniref:Restriction modification system DNA specificity subunit n=2 Tax=Pseudomonas putida TaxID=303 RepID=I3UT68_PSEPU|nr:MULTISPECIES: restriction endonuclease subunit S [Pseudomonas]MPT16021.1 restriction endonuclease subunit S [Microbacterium sp.]AFK68689.1 restriction modification system DNA specificity subunit [Pseudomonas putida ND6]ANI05511.1 restriction endonuclease [Pseudomonas putida SJTE-1]MDD2000736.1 restriction endonuclease subunit S [Pseudomonas putida]POA85768.1 restriction endonuclease [Pseudomonas sp. FW305-E2]
MTSLLTDNLPLLAGAPNGIKKLRELILELAVRGKLVPQDPEDLSARTGLDASRTERAKAMLEGKIKKEKPAMEVADSEQPFELPDGWAWCRIVDTGNYINGLAFKPSDWSSTGRPIIRIQNLSGRNAEFNRTEREVDASVVVNPGDILVSWSATLDTFIWRGEQGVLNQHIFRVTPSKIVSVQYLYWLLKWAIKVLADSEHAHGLVMAHINRGPFLAQPIGLPPLTEQNKIVVKIAELMALCDRLEARQADADSAHAQLVQALLGSLTQASDAADFAQSWQRLAEHFHTLFTTESSIDALKQTLLQLAVMGKLVPQDSRDEPASELLKRVSEEKARLVAEGKLKKQKPLGDVAISDIPFDVPDNWAWSRIGEIALNTEYGLSEKTFDLQDGVPVLKMGDIQEGRVLLGGQMAVSKNTEGLPGLYLETEDLLYNRTNSAELVGKTGVFLGQAGEYSFASYLIRIRCLKELFSPLYLNISMNAPGFRETQINPHLKQQCGQANVNGTIMKNMLVSVPPLPEQHRIVAKVDQLMALCEQLKTRLNQALQVHEHLASALVEQAVA